MSSHVSVHRTMKAPIQARRPRRGISWAIGWAADLSLLCVGMAVALVTPRLLSRDD